MGFSTFSGVVFAQPGESAPTPTTTSPEPADTKKSPEADTKRTTWMIVLFTFRGEDRTTLANEALKLVQTHGLGDAYIETRGPATVVGIGRFADAASDEARKEVERVRAVEIDGTRPFLYSFFAPPDSTSAMGNRPEYNLTKAKEQFGDQARFTLQVAAFGPADLQNPKAGELEQARRDAEQAAAILRNEGELAYYYHGKSLSMVTIGAWDEKAFGDRQDPMDDDQTLTAAKKRFPYNIYNGGGVKVKQGKDAKAKLQKSQLVSVPDA